MNNETIKGKSVYLLVRLSKRDNEDIVKHGVDFSALLNSNVSIVDAYESENDAINDGFKMLDSEVPGVIFMPVKFTIK